MIRELLTAVARLLPKRVITRDDGDPYLERYYLAGDPSGLKYFPESERWLCWWQRPLTWLPCIYLHRFVASDADEELHNHPWQAASLIVAGGYVEERREPPGAEGGELQYWGSDVISGIRVPNAWKVVARTFRPWTVNYLHANTYHRVRLLGDDCWSIIKIGEKVQSWGFWSPASGEFVHWRQHLANRKQRAKVNASGGRA